RRCALWLASINAIDIENGSGEIRCRFFVGL
ncbi:MAG: hypothetical protein ACI8PG_000792, partial [Planctomycetota bacterium]